MYETAYDIVALGMRYVFVAMIVYILLRTANSVYREYTCERSIRKGVSAASWGAVEVVAPADAPFLGEEYILKRENTIGRAKRCDICLPHESLSSVHAAVFQRREKLYISDYGSKNGVKVNGEKVRRDYRLEDGDVLSLGRVLLKVHLGGEEDGNAR